MNSSDQHRQELTESLNTPTQISSSNQQPPSNKKTLMLSVYMVFLFGVVVIGYIFITNKMSEVELQQNANAAEEIDLTRSPVFSLTKPPEY